MRPKDWQELFDKMDDSINRVTANNRRMRAWIDSMHLADVQQDAVNIAQEQKNPSENIPVNKRAEILSKAEELINGDRAQAYGPPEISFGRIADIWNAMGYRRHVAKKPDPETEPYIPSKELVIYKAEKLDAIDVAHMLIGMKLSRSVGSRGKSLDDWVDLAGYSGLGGELSAPDEVPNADDEASPVPEKERVTFKWVPGLVSYRCVVDGNYVSPSNILAHINRAHSMTAGYTIDINDGPLRSINDEDPTPVAFTRPQK